MKEKDKIGDTDSEIGFAEQEFANFCDANEIDHDELAMEDEDCEGFRKIKSRFIKAINEKRLVVDGMKLVYTVSRFSETAGDKITISRPIGKDFLSMDGLKDTQQMHKFNAFLASITRKENSYISRLDFKDRGFLNDIGTLFITA